MLDFLNSLSELAVPSWVYAALPFALAIVALYLFWYINTRIFKFHFRRIINAQDAEHLGEAIKKFEQHYPAKKLVIFSSSLERYSRKMGPRVVRETGLADRWLQKLTRSSLPRVKDLRRVLLYCPDSALFKAFLAAEQRPRLRKVFLAWMQSENKSEEQVIQLLAESYRGEPFVPDFSKRFLENSKALLFELTGNPEWYARYFAYRILLVDKESLTERSLQDGLNDPHPSVRRILTENVSFDPDQTWDILWDKLIHDPIYEVRKAARGRIAKEYMGRYDPKDTDMSDEEAARVLELLDAECQEDKMFAMVCLGGNRELSFHAAVYLEKCGTLLSLLTRNSLDDPATLDQSVPLLQKALEVNISGFLGEYASGDGGPLLVAARLLSSPTGTRSVGMRYGGTAENICVLEKKVFAFFQNKKPTASTREIYTKTLEAVTHNGNEKAYELAAEEILNREGDQVFLEMLLEQLPQKAESVFAPILFRFFENPAFPLREKLVQVLAGFNPDTVLPKMLQILGAASKHPYIVFVSALKLLGLMKLPFCLQRILESLPLVQTEDREEFGRIIADYPPEVFEPKSRTLLASPDAGIRAAIISILPITKNESFMKEIRSSLKDVDPDVRIAAINALLGFGEIKLLNQETSMLHDPVERVRLATAEVIANHGNAAAMEILNSITGDPNETDVVKIGVITGLGKSTNIEGIKILVHVLDSMDDLREYAQKALSMRVAKRDITQLIEIFKDAEPPLREKLIPVFTAQGSNAEPQIVEILKDEVASIKPYFVSILEETGYIGVLIRRLSHKKAETRREAAMQLSLMDTLSAYRGLIFAAKDPDQEVRVHVVKALEKIKNSQSREILENLKNDPDNRIRKYTHWALERLDSLGME